MRMHTVAAAAVLDALLMVVRDHSLFGTLLSPVLWCVAIGSAVTCGNRLRLIANDLNGVGGAPLAGTADINIARVEDGNGSQSQESDDAAPSPPPENAVSGHAMEMFASIEQLALWFVVGASLGVHAKAELFVVSTDEHVDSTIAASPEKGSVHWGLAKMVVVLLVVASVVAAAMPPSPLRLNIRQRLWTWWFLIGIFLFAIFFEMTTTLLMFMAYLAFKEFLSIQPQRKTDRRALLLAYCFIPLQFLLVRLQWFGFFAVLIPVFAFISISGRVALRQRTTKNFLRSVSSIHFGLMVITFSFFFFLFTDLTWKKGCLFAFSCCIFG